MKIQDILIYSVAFIVTGWAVQYFLGTWYPKNPSTEVRSGQSFTAAASEQLLKPFNTEVNFVENGHESPIKTDVKTQNGEYDFTTAGATLETISLSRTINHKQEFLTTLKTSDAVHENRAFLVALDTATPYDYQFVEKRNNDHATILTYEAQTADAIIRKQFIIDNQFYKIALTLTLEPRNKKSIQPRIFLPGPVLESLGTAQNSMGIVFTDKQAIQKTKPADLVNKIWAQPTLFGTENKYFIHALISDPDSFTQRAYYKIGNVEHVTAILEGPSVTEKTSWTLTFYCGPKEAPIFNVVDPRLEETLEYGWLGPISKLLLTFLNFIYSYVHNYGWAIVIMTLLMNIVTFPLVSRGTETLKKQAEYEKKKQYLEQKYKHDKEMLAQEQAELVKKYGVSALGFMGCLPQLLFLPIFMALNRVLSNSIELYHAPFIGWITDLSAKDPYYILPVLFGVGILVQSTGTDPRQFVTRLIVCLVVIGISGNFSAGLTLFLCTKTFADAAQNYLQKRYRA